MTFSRVVGEDGGAAAGGMCDVYSGRGRVVGALPDREAVEAGLVDALGFPVEGWVRHPGGPT